MVYYIWKERVNIVQILTRLLSEDMKPALGVTEPGAIAYAVAKACTYVTGEWEQIKVRLNSGIYKNGFTCGIPNSDEVGNVFAAALGAVCGKAHLLLQSLDSITEEDTKAAKKLVDEGKVQVFMDHISSDIFIEATVVSTKGNCVVTIRERHTNVTKIVRDGEIVFEGESPVDDTKRETSIKDFAIEDFISYVNDVPLEEISFIREAFLMNMDLLEAGLASDKTIFAKQLFLENENRLISQDGLKTAQLLCNGAIEARVLGCAQPAMSITGSGAHGIIATMPLFAYYQVNLGVVDDDVLIRATALGFLVTQYIKAFSGVLSSLCGCAIGAGTGMACGLAYLRGASYIEIHHVILNMASGMTGMICDGGNPGCVMKGIVAVDAAFRAVDFAMQGLYVGEKHGINGQTAEKTLQNMGKIAFPGMASTEEEIVDIIRNK